MHPATGMALIYNVNVQKSFSLTRRGSRTPNELAARTYLCDVANVQPKIYMILLFFPPLLIRPIIKILLRRTLNFHAFYRYCII